MIPKGVARTIHYLAWNTVNNAPEPGDAANHTLQVLNDGILAPADNAPANMNVLNKVLLTATEMDGNSIALAGVSSTPGVRLIPIIIITDEKSLGIQIFIPFTVWDTLTNSPVLGDAGNLSMFVAADGVEAAALIAPIEISALLAPGLYGILTEITENVAPFMSVSGTSITPTAEVLPISYATDPGRFTASYNLPQEVILEDDEIIIFEECL